MDQLSKRQVERVFVYGDPAFYARFGFETGLATHYQPPYPLQHPRGGQAKSLSELGTVPASGQVSCVQCLSDPKFW
jgi:putative acetyltransferase